MMIGIEHQGITFEASESSDDDALRSSLEHFVAARYGSYAAIHQVDRSAVKDGSSYAAEVLTLTLRGGDQLRLFVKYFGPSRYAKGDVGSRARCELAAYRDLLSAADLGTAAYYGALWNETRARRWLFLEHVSGTAIEYREFSWWVAAARWLARLHQDVAERANRAQLASLLSHDARFFRSTATTAICAVASVSSRLGDCMAEVVRRYDLRIGRMVDEPQALVHGAFKPRHVLVDDTREPCRVCPIDWELAASGSRLYDLAFLAHGFVAPQLDELLQAYRDEALLRDVPVAGVEEMRYLVDCFRIHRILKALCRAEERQFSEARIGRAIESMHGLLHDGC
jgi:hypothetical protein